VIQKVKVQLVLVFRVGMVAYDVYASALFRDEMVVVVVDEAQDPVHSNMLFQYILREITNHSSCRR
jgi:hypothetical protein